jgi:type IV pilus assembly protein PilN
MRITLNLATQPYIDLRSILVRLRVIAAILAVVSVPLWLLQRSEQHKAQVATAHVQAMENNVQRLEQQQRSYRALMQQPQNAAVLEQSEFLNSLFRRKAFSWTATMTDLETVLPGGVQVLSLDPQVARDGRVTIRMRTSGARNRAVELVKNLEKSRHFASPRLIGEALAQTNSGPNAAVQPVSADAAVNFDILSDYRPLSADEEKPETAPDSSAAPGSANDLEEKPKKVANAPSAHRPAAPAARPKTHPPNAHPPAGGAQ